MYGDRGSRGMCVRVRGLILYGNSKLSDSVFNEQQLVMRQILARQELLQVQQGLQSCLYTSITKIPCKISLGDNNQLFDVISQRIYAYNRLVGRNVVTTMRW